MKLRLMVVLAAILVLVACADTEKEPNDVSEKETNSEEKANKEAEEENENKKDSESEASDSKETTENQETKIEKTDPEEEENGSDDSTSDSTDSEKKEEQDDGSDEDETEKVDPEKDIVAFGFAVFDAQINEDYDYLESVLSKGSSIDRENHTIQFDQAASPHQFEFITEEDRANTGERYIQDEDDGSVIVGYEVIDYANESSYIIDVQFIKEDGEWKVNDMDVNK